MLELELELFLEEARFLEVSECKVCRGIDDVGALL